MPTLLIYGVVLFTLALFLYSISVWAGWFSKRLKLWHIYVFSAGLVTDLIATVLTYISIGGIVITPHSVIGFISIILMVLHVVWAIVTILRGNEKSLTGFHRLSMVVWSIWMVSYLSGFFLGMVKVV